MWRTESGDQCITDRTEACCNVWFGDSRMRVWLEMLGLDWLITWPCSVCESVIHKLTHNGYPSEGALSSLNSTQSNTISVLRLLAIDSWCTLDCWMKTDVCSNKVQMLHGIYHFPLAFVCCPRWFHLNWYVCGLVLRLQSRTGARTRTVSVFNCTLFAVTGWFVPVGLWETFHINQSHKQWEDSWLVLLIFLDR